METRIWHATIVDPLAPSYLPASATRAGAAAGFAENRKIQKYSALLDTHIFVPVAIETLGPINDKGVEFIADLGRQLTQATGEPRESSFFFQRLSITIPRFNAVAFSGSFVKPAIDTDEG